MRQDNTIAITPVLPIEEPDNSLSMGDEHLDTILATESDEVIKSSVEDLVPIPSESEGIPDKIDDDSPYGEDIDYVDASSPDVEIVSLEVVEIVDPEVGRIDDDILLTIKDDILREKLLNVNLLIAKIDSLRDNPTPSSEVVIKSTSTFPNLFLEETNTFDNSSPEAETFCFDLEEISSGSTTTRSDYSLPDYEAFYSNDDHIEEISSGSTTTHADFSKYDSFIFDLTINLFPPADRSDFYHEELASELAHIISPSEYDHFCFKIEPELGNLAMDVLEDIFQTREPRVHVPNVLPTHSTLDLDLILFSEPLFAYIVWIFLLFLTYPVAPPYLLSCGNEDTIFDPGISIYHSFMPGISHRSGTFMKFNDFPDVDFWRCHLPSSCYQTVSPVASDPLIRWPTRLKSAEYLSPSQTLRGQLNLVQIKASSWKRIAYRLPLAALSLTAPRWISNSSASRPSPPSCHEKANGHCKLGLTSTVSLTTQRCPSQSSQSKNGLQIPGAVSRMKYSKAGVQMSDEAERYGLEVSSPSAVGWKVIQLPEPTEIPGPSGGNIRWWYNRPLSYQVEETSALIRNNSRWSRGEACAISPPPPLPHPHHPSPYPHPHPHHPSPYLIASFNGDSLDDADIAPHHLPPPMGNS
ncbi:hypothetical protein Tco_0453815 [Tanacetum coccineum]